MLLGDAASPTALMHGATTVVTVVAAAAVAAVAAVLELLPELEAFDVDGLSSQQALLLRRKLVSRHSSATTATTDA